MKVTAENITDEQIRELMESVSLDEKFDGHQVAAMCGEALGMAHIHGSTVAASKRRIADYLNARAAASTSQKAGGL